MIPTAKIQRWADKAAELSRVKAEEMALRLELVDLFWPTRGTGTKTLDLGKGFTLAVTFDTNYTLAVEDKTRPALENIAAADPAGPELAKRLVKWTPELRVGEFKKLPTKLQRMILEVLTLKPATPTLELRVPKS